LGKIDIFHAFDMERWPNFLTYIGSSFFTSNIRKELGNRHPAPITKVKGKGEKTSMIGISSDLPMILFCNLYYSMSVLTTCTLIVSF
jgi:hypothetical protein